MNATTWNVTAIAGPLPSGPPHASLRSINQWFAFSLIISLIACLLLVLLLATSLTHEKLRKGSKILVIHLLFLQLAICGVNFPILTITSYQTLVNQPISPFDCSTFLYLDIAMTHVENWASTGLAFNRYGWLFLWHIAFHACTPKKLKHSNGNNSAKWRQQEDFS